MPRTTKAVKKVAKPTKKKTKPVEAIVTEVDTNIVPTGKTNKGKREFKNLTTGTTYFE